MGKLLDRLLFSLEKEKSHPHPIPQMTLSRIEMDVMRAIEGMVSDDIPALISAVNRQAEAQERVAKQLEELMAFLHGTTIEQVEAKRKKMRNNNKKRKSHTSAKIKDLKDFVEKSTSGE